LSSDWGICQGSVGPGEQDSCSIVGDDTDCDGTDNGGCPCVDGQTQPCGPDTENGICQRGIQTCVNGNFGGGCDGAVFPVARSCGAQQDNDCDGRPDNIIDAFCECIPGQGNGPCSVDPNNSRCNAQGQCVPCQANADCSLVAGRVACVGGVCSTPLLPEGSDCTSSLQCSGGNCRLWFEDEDVDGYGNQASIRRTCGIAPAGFVANSDDCCDSDPDARPGQEEFFNSPRVGCGGFDYNCFGGNELAPFTVGLTNCESLVFPSCTERIWTSNGVNGVRPPDCGQAGGATFCGALGSSCTSIAGGELISSCH
jgi:hypothetical protein